MKRRIGLEMYSPIGGLMASLYSLKACFFVWAVFDFNLYPGP